MLYLKNVTITGADNETDVGKMLELTRRFPFVEWGILISLARTGNNRYPSKEWIRNLHNIFNDWKLEYNLAYHVCGSLSRDLIVGRIISEQWDKCVPYANQFNVRRMQINVNISKCEYYAEAFVKLVKLLRSRIHVIVQYNENNKNLWFDLVLHGLRPHILFDASGGRGVVSKEIPTPMAGLLCGFAGGLNPDNVEEYIAAITKKWIRGIYWIDMESGVRDSNNRLDLNKVEAVLERCKKYILR